MNFKYCLKKNLVRVIQPIDPCADGKGLFQKFGSCPETGKRV